MSKESIIKRAVAEFKKRFCPEKLTEDESECDKPPIPVCTRKETTIYAIFAITSWYPAEYVRGIPFSEQKGGDGNVIPFPTDKKPDEQNNEKPEGTA